MSFEEIGYIRLRSVQTCFFNLALAQHSPLNSERVNWLCFFK
jgi:hypothetical protein